MWSQWSPWQGRDEENEETKTQQKMAEEQRRPRGAEYYQRSKSEVFTAKASENVAMDKGKVKPPGGVTREDGISHSQQQVVNIDVGEDWEAVEHEDLEKLQVHKKVKKRKYKLGGFLRYTCNARIPLYVPRPDTQSMRVYRKRLTEKAKKSGKAPSQGTPAIQEQKCEGLQEKHRLDDSYNALDQALKDNQELHRRQSEALKRVAELEKRNKGLRVNLAMKEAELKHLRHELTASSGSTSTLSTDSARYHTPYSNLSENGSECRGLVQVDSTDSDILLRLQMDNECKEDTIKVLEREVNILKKRLEYAERLEEQNVQLTTEESKHEEEKQLLRREVDLLKRKVSVGRSRRSYAHEQKLQELAQRYEQQYHEELDENSRLREKISQLEKETQEQEVTTHIDEVDDPDLNAELRKKDQHIHTLQSQVDAMQQHSKGQSKQIVQLKQELEALKLSGEEIDTSWREMVDQLEEENKKLSMDVGVMNRDKKLLEKSMEATKAKNEEVELLSQKLQKEKAALCLELAAQKYKLQHQLDETEATVRQLEADLNFSRARVAELEGENTKLEEVIAGMKELLSVQEHDRRRIFQDLSKCKMEKEALLQAAQAEQLQLRQLTQEKDRFIQSLQSEKDQLRQQLSALSWQIQRCAQQPQSQHPHESNFWEVPRNEITLNMHKILGTGAWGFVVEGTFRGQKVAVKCLHDLIRQPKTIKVICKEIDIMAQIRHPNLVLLIAAVIDAENDPLIVTELLDISLRKAYEKRCLQDSSKLSIFRDVASALNYLHLHQRGEIIHRDVSSANILLEAKPNDQWKAKLSDFGSAKLATEAKTTGPGAPAYTAPEVQKEMGICQTGKLDVYSYGVLLCEVIEGQFPIEGSLPSMVQAVQSSWPSMHSLVTSCTQEHPDKRPTMSHVLGELDKLQPKHLHLKTS